MSVVARHTLELELELDAKNMRELELARKTLAERVVGVVPFAPVTVAGGGRVRVLFARVSSPGLPRPVEVRPYSRRVASKGGEA